MCCVKKKRQCTSLDTFSELFDESNDVKELVMAGTYWHNPCNIANVRMQLRRDGVV